MCEAGHERVSLSLTSSSRTPAPPLKDTEYLIGGAIDKKYFSTTGAFNGSGIALASQSFSPTGSDTSQGTIVMYFQHVSIFIVTPLRLCLTLTPT